jgi:hypothetical protein
MLRLLGVFRSRYTAKHKQPPPEDFFAKYPPVEAWANLREPLSPRAAKERARERCAVSSIYSSSGELGSGVLMLCIVLLVNWEGCDYGNDRRRRVEYTGIYYSSICRISPIARSKQSAYVTVRTRFLRLHFFSVHLRSRYTAFLARTTTLAQEALLWKHISELEMQRVSEEETGILLE